MGLLNIRLFSTIVLLILSVNLSTEDIGDWFSDENLRTTQHSSDNSTDSEILSTGSSESSSFSPTSTTSSPEYGSTTLSTTPTTSPTPLPSSSTVYIPLTSAQTIISPTSWIPSIDQTTQNSSDQPIECLKIGLNAKIIFKYVSNESIEQQFEIIGGNSNGELIQPNKCMRNQTLIIKYDLVEKTRLKLGIFISDTDVSIYSIRFEYPFDRLPDDFNKDNHSEEVQTCSQDELTSILYNKCLIAENKDLSDFSLKYKINDQIYCKELPLIVLKNSKTSIDIQLKDYRLIVTDSQTNDLLMSTNDEYCPINPDIDLGTIFAGHTKIWVGISYAVVGALIMFGFAFFHEKVIRKRLWYNPIDREEPEI